ncbi:MAG: hypothetical protein ACR2QT_04965 [Woeseiaceae bacterium]
MNHLLLSIILVTVAACATPSALENRSDAVRSSETTASPETVPANGSGGSMLEQHATAKNPSSNALEAPNEIEALEAPGVSELPAAMIPGRPAPEQAIVCENVVPSGSVLRTEVCRHQADIERKRAADQELFDRIKRNTALGNARL